MSQTTDPDIGSRLEKFSNLPSIPQVILRIKQVSEDPKASVADLANCILSDHQLTGRILRMANSTYYGDYAGKVNTITQAIVLMGFRAIRNIALTMSVYGTLNKLVQKSEFDLTSFWRRSVGVGVIAKYLAQRGGHGELIEAAFIAGFLHDIGQVILAAVFTEEYEKISRSHTEAEDVAETERALLGIDHCQAGALVAQQWNLPPALIASISRHHETPDEREDEYGALIVDIVHLAEQLYRHLISVSKPATQTTYGELVERVIRVAKVSSAALEELPSVCREQIAEIAADLQIEVGDSFEAGDDEAQYRMQQQLQRKELQINVMQAATTAIMGAGSADQMSQILCEIVFTGLQLGRVIMFAYDNRTNRFVGQVGFGEESQDKIRQYAFPADKGMFSRMKAGGQPISILGRDTKVYGAVVSGDEITSLDAHAFVAVPLAVEGRVRYVLFADLPVRTDPVDDETQRSLVSLTQQAALCLEHAAMKAKLAAK